MHTLYLVREENIVLIVLDTLRKDYGDKYIWPVLKKYGFKKYDRVVAPAPWTTPSHVSMLTGLYPSEHGTYFDVKNHAEELNKFAKNHLITTELKALGYTSVLFSANILVSPYTGFMFDRYIDILPFSRPDFTDKKNRECINKVLRHRSQKTEKVIAIISNCGIRALLSLLKTRLVYPIIKYAKGWPKDKGISNLIERLEKIPEQRKLFLMMNLIEVHEPYLLPIDFDPKFLWRKLYERESAYLAKRLDVLLEILFDKFPPKDTLYIITSDHGQLLGEYGLYGHTYWLHDELLFVPLYLRGNYNEVEVLQGGSWISLTQIKNLILNKQLEKKDWVLAESFATRHKKSIKLIHRIAVYYKDYKGIYNVDEKKWEYWKTYNEEPKVPEKAKKEMEKIVKKHLKKSLVRNKAKELGKILLKRKLAK